MGNIIKYEFRGYLKELLGSSLIIVLVNLLLLTRINSWERESILGFSILICFIAFVAVFIWNIGMFSKDLYRDTGYLLFTLPQSGYSILGGKIIAAILQSLIIGIVSLLFIYINLHSIEGAGKFINDYVGFKVMFLSAMMFVLLYLYLLMQIYFSIAISKAAIRKKKLGKLSGFIVFIVISIIFSKITDILIKIFPQNINFNTAKLFGAKLMLQANSVNQFAFEVNIATTIFTIVSFILLFVGTAYVLENKIDF